jgi:uncharacterized membrane protein YhaH (DUF805 family)
MAGDTVTEERGDIPDDDEEFGPGSPDYDLSEERGYGGESERGFWPPPPWVFVAISILIVVALLVPTLAIIGQR